MKRSHLAAGWAALGISTFVASAAQAAGIGFVPVALSGGQNVRVTLVNYTPPDPILPPDPCRGTVTVHNAAGGLESGPFAFVLGAGRALSVPSSERMGGGQVHRHAVVHFLVSAPEADTVRSNCTQTFAGEEIFSTLTGQTQFMNPGVIRGFNPQPDPPGFQ